MEQFVADRPRRRRHWKKILIPLLALVLAVGLLIWIIHGLNAPAEGSISQTPPSQAQKADPYAQPGTFNGKYLSFQYPAHFKLINTKITGSYLETVGYSSTDQSGREINVGVYQGSVASDSGVVYRRQHPELYKETDSQLGLEFVKLDGTEDTFFLQHDGLIATVSATAPNANLNGEAYYVASSLQWK